MYDTYISISPVRACVRACVHAYVCVRACVCAYIYVCVRACLSESEKLSFDASIRTYIRRHI